MEVVVQMAFIEDGAGGRMPTFWLLGFYPSVAKKSAKHGDYWAEWLDDKSIMPIAHLMERAYRLNQMVIFKKPDDTTQRLLRAYQRRARLKADISVAINTEGGGRLWQGDYRFGFFVEQMLANQSDKDGNKWEQLQLSIIDQTEQYPAIE
ncbi:MAG TPA: hypothetical protein VF721_08880 [Pyrinomonadaceae bacterium]|jgi:hypothetical protein